MHDHRNHEPAMHDARMEPIATSSGTDDTQPVPFSPTRIVDRAASDVVRSVRKSKYGKLVIAILGLVLGALGIWNKVQRGSVVQL